MVMEEMTKEERNAKFLKENPSYRGYSGLPPSILSLRKISHERMRNRKRRSATRLAKILRLRRSGKSLREAGMIMGISGERVRMIIKKSR